MQLGGPDELTKALALTLVPDHILLGVGQTLDGIRHTDDQAVIAVRPVLAVDGIGGGEVVQVPLLVVGDAGVCPLLNEGVLGVGVVSTATDGAPDGVLHAGTAGVHLVQVGGIPAHIVGALFPVGVLGDQLTHSLIQSLLGIAILLHGHLLGHRGDGGVVGVGVLGGELVILRPGQGDGGGPHSVRGHTRQAGEGIICTLYFFEHRQILGGVLVHRPGLILYIQKVFLCGQIVHARQLGDAGHAGQGHRALVGVVDEVVRVVHQDGGVVAAIPGDHGKAVSICLAQQHGRHIGLGPQGGVHDGLVLVQSGEGAVCLLLSNLHAAGLATQAIGGQIGVIAHIGGDVRALLQHHQLDVLGHIVGPIQAQGGGEGHSGVAVLGAGHVALRRDKLLIAGGPGDGGSPDGVGQLQVSGNIASAQSQLVPINGQIAIGVLLGHRHGKLLGVRHLTQGDGGGEGHLGVFLRAHHGAIGSDDIGIAGGPGDGGVATAAHGGQGQVHAGHVSHGQSGLVPRHNGSGLGLVGQVLGAYLVLAESLGIDLEVIHLEVPRVPVVGAGCAQIDKLGGGDEVQHVVGALPRVDALGGGRQLLNQGPILIHANLLVVHHHGDMLPAAVLGDGTAKLLHVLIGGGAGVVVEVDASVAGHAIEAVAIARARREAPNAQPGVHGIGVDPCAHREAAGQVFSIQRVVGLDPALPAARLHHLAPGIIGDKGGLAGAFSSTHSAGMDGILPVTIELVIGREAVLWRSRFGLHHARNCHVAGQHTCRQQH